MNLKKFKIKKTKKGGNLIFKKVYGNFVKINENINKTVNLFKNVKELFNTNNNEIFLENSKNFINKYLKISNFTKKNGGGNFKLSIVDKILISYSLIILVLLLLERYLYQIFETINVVNYFFTYAYTDYIEFGLSYTIKNIFKKMLKIIEIDIFSEINPIASDGEFVHVTNDVKVMNVVGDDNDEIPIAEKIDINTLHYLENEPIEYNTYNYNEVLRHIYRYSPEKVATFKNMHIGGKKYFNSNNEFMKNNEKTDLENTQKYHAGSNDLKINQNNFLKKFDEILNNSNSYFKKLFEISKLIKFNSIDKNLKKIIEVLSSNKNMAIITSSLFAISYAISYLLKKPAKKVEKQFAKNTDLTKGNMEKIENTIDKQIKKAEEKSQIKTSAKSK
jgi:hypothetical protein